MTRDRWGRTVAWVHVGEHCLNEEILRAGYAWHFKRYSQDMRLAELERKARTERAGLWSEPAPVPPWEFRKSRTRAHAEQARQEAPRRIH